MIVSIDTPQDGIFQTMKFIEIYGHDNYINHFEMSLLFDTPQECLVKTTFKDSCATLFFTLPASSIWFLSQDTQNIG